jgi:MFS family permease
MDRRALVSGCAAGFAFSANYTNHAPMISVLRGEFGFDRTRAGLLTTAIFLTHALMMVPGGRLGDRFGAGRVIAAALAWIAAANFALAFAGAYWQLLFWKAVAGIGTGACFATGARCAHARFPCRNRAPNRRIHAAVRLRLGAAFAAGVRRVPGAVRPHDFGALWHDRNAHEYVEPLRR